MSLLYINSASKCISFLKQWLHNLPSTVSLYIENKHHSTNPIKKIMIQLLSSIDKKNWYVRIIHINNQWKIEYNHKFIEVGVVFDDIVNVLCHIITRYQKKVIFQVSVTFSSPLSPLPLSSPTPSITSSPLYISFNKESTYPSNLFSLSPTYHQVLYWYNFDTMNSEISNKSQQLKTLLSFGDYMEKSIHPKQIDHSFLDQLVRYTYLPPHHITFKSIDQQLNVSQVNILLKDQIEEISVLSKPYAHYTWDWSNQHWKCERNILDLKKKTTLIQTPQQLQKELYKIVNFYVGIPMDFVVELLTDDVNRNEKHIKSKTSNVVFDVASTYIPGNFRLDKDNVWRFVYDIRQFKYDNPRQMNEVVKQNHIHHQNTPKKINNYNNEKPKHSFIDLNPKKPSPKITIAKTSDIRLPINSTKQTNYSTPRSKINKTSQAYQKSINSAPFLENLSDVEQKIHNIRGELKKDQENSNHILNQENYSSYKDLNNLLDTYENRYEKILTQNALVDKWNEVNMKKLKESI